MFFNDQLRATLDRSENYQPDQPDPYYQPDLFEPYTRNEQRQTRHHLTS